jgi:outer membrane protein assembly factor BamB
MASNDMLGRRFLARRYVLVAVGAALCVLAAVLLTADPQTSDKGGSAGHGRPPHTLWSRPVNADLALYDASVSKVIGFREFLFKSDDTLVMSFSATTGRLNWQTKVPGLADESGILAPAITPVLAVTSNSYQHAADAHITGTSTTLTLLSSRDGRAAWSLRKKGYFQTVVTDDYVIATLKSGLSALEVDSGHVHWRRPYRPDCVVNDLVASNTLVGVVTECHGSYALQVLSASDGSIVWERNTRRGSPEVTIDEDVVVVNAADVCNLYDDRGNVIVEWERKYCATEVENGTPCIDVAADLIVLCTRAAHDASPDGLRVVAIERVSTRVRWAFAARGFAVSMLALHDDTVTIAGSAVQPGVGARYFTVDRRSGEWIGASSEVMHSGLRVLTDFGYVEDTDDQPRRAPIRAVHVDPRYNAFASPWIDPCDLIADPPVHGGRAMLLLPDESAYMSVPGAARLTRCDLTSKLVAGPRASSEILWIGRTAEQASSVMASMRSTEYGFRDVDIGDDSYVVKSSERGKPYQGHVVLRVGRAVVRVSISAGIGTTTRDEQESKWGKPVLLDIARFVDHRLVAHL